MKLTKDEASILAEAMEDYKYKVINDYKDFKDLGAFEKLHVLQRRLESYGDDKRRHGRTSLNSFYDLIVRFCKNKLKTTK